MSGIYSSLPDPRSHIRLLKVDPVAEGAIVQCSLSVVSLSDNPRYSALSYVWGDPSITEAIMVNGQLKHVTKNLGNALRYVPQHWSTAYPDDSLDDFRLWVDALCINQSDIPEKNEQVQLMSTIYPMAECVISWLGDDKRISFGLELVAIMAYEAENVPKSMYYFLEWLVKYPQLYPNSPGHSGDTAKNVENEATDDSGKDTSGNTGNDVTKAIRKVAPKGTRNVYWLGLRALLELPYWTRTWILQEVGLGSYTLLCSHDKYVSFDDLIFVQRQLKQTADGVLEGDMRSLKFSGKWMSWEFVMSLDWRHLDCFARGRYGAWDEDASDEDEGRYEDGSDEDEGGYEDGSDEDEGEDVGGADEGEDVDALHTQPLETELSNMNSLNIDSPNKTSLDITADWTRVWLGKDLEATEPKDHVYGLLSLSNLDLEVDYSEKKTVGDLYCELVVKWLEECAPYESKSQHENYEFGVAVSDRMDRLYFLQFSGVGLYENKLGLPSWAPNFPEESRNRVSLGFSSQQAADKEVFPDGVEDAKIEGSTLVVRGIAIGEILRVEEDALSTSGGIESLLSYLCDYLARKQHDGTEISPLDTIIRTIQRNSRVFIDSTITTYGIEFLKYIRENASSENPLARLGFEFVDLEDFETISKEDLSKFNDSFKRVLPSYAKSQDQADYNWYEEFYIEMEGHNSLGLERDLRLFAPAWRFFETSGGLVGVGPLRMQRGDSIFVLSGSRVPIVLRKHDDHYIHVGECFLLGYMRGEARELLKSGKASIEVVRIR